MIYNNGILLRENAAREYILWLFVMEFYKWIKIAGMISFIPVVLAAGIFSGYFVGEFLIRKTGVPAFILPLCIIIGTLASVIEVARIIRLVIKAEK